LPADDAGEKTERPTPRRREEAREQGQVARSTDLTAAAALIGGLLLLALLGPQMYSQMLALTREMSDASDPRAGAIAACLARSGYAAAATTLPLLLWLVVVTAGGALLQVGPLAAWKKLRPKLDYLSPIRGLRRIFSAESVTRALLALLKLTLVAVVAYATLSTQLRPLLATATLPPEGVLPAAGALVLTLALRMALLLLLLGLVDYGYQRWKLERSLRMTRQEVREELKRMEGDPLLKQRRRQIQAKLALQRLRIDVPRADVVVTNPSEYAVALRYDEATMRAPRLLAKGKDFLALQIRRIAQEQRVPIVQRPPLARALYAAVDVGAEVPPQFYRAVAEVLAYVYRLTGRAAG